jgi:hypothetical protein
MQNALVQGQLCGACGSNVQAKRVFITFSGFYYRGKSSENHASGNVKRAWGKFVDDVTSLRLTKIVIIVI